MNGVKGTEKHQTLATKDVSAFSFIDEKNNIDVGPKKHWQDKIILMEQNNIDDTDMKLMSCFSTPNVCLYTACQGWKIYLSPSLVCVFVTCNLLTKWWKTYQNIGNCDFLSNVKFECFAKTTLLYLINSLIFSQTADLYQSFHFFGQNSYAFVFMISLGTNLATASRSPATIGRKGPAVLFLS